MRTNEDIIKAVAMHIVFLMNEYCLEEYDVKASDMTAEQWAEMDVEDDADFFRSHKEDAREHLIELVGTEHDLVTTFGATWKQIRKAYFR